uniref:very-long-chain (3R)-3-hydroxyacyl-CoA dehydratase n=1 Tax=Peronospora matthiolae TaxID=2874970 RepID=A0AAV1UDT9_9STRA
MANSSQLNPFLLVFNDVTCAGWAYVLYLTMKTVLKAREGDNLDWSQVAQITWDVVSLLLKVVQTMAVMDIVHDAVGFVRSPVGSTIMQLPRYSFHALNLYYAVPSFLFL